MKAYLIPGWGEDLNSREYTLVLNAYKEAGYDPVFIPITWNYKTIEDWVEEVKSKVSQKDLENSLLSGFSFGAVTALSLAGYYQLPKKLLLFSLSCYYADDQQTIPAWWLKEIGKKRAESFRNINFKDLTQRINCPTWIFIGSKEDPEMNIRAKAAHEGIKISELITVDGAGHNVADPAYVKAISQSINT